MGHSMKVLKRVMDTRLTDCWHLWNAVGVHERKWNNGCYMDRGADPRETVRTKQYRMCICALGTSC